MTLWAHHVAVELFGREFSPETPLEHALAFGVSGLLLALMVYGAYAGLRDLARWRHRYREQKSSV
jgi:hypothetical protein